MKTGSPKKPLIGIVGQGFVGKGYADDFERRKFRVVRYSLEHPHIQNKHRIQDAHIVFVCVPTPTTPKGFDVSIVEETLALIGRGSIAVIKSTLLPGTTAQLQKKFAHITIIFSPEFLNAATATEDAANPFANVLGIPSLGQRHRKAAELVHHILPKSPFAHTCSSEEAEIYKYAHNVSGYMQVLVYNMMYDLAQGHGADWDAIHKALVADPMVSNWYIKPVHKSGRGAGGTCFIKDFAAFARHYGKIVGKPEGIALLKAAEKKNIALLVGSKKDPHLLRGVYGKKVLKRPARAKKKGKR
ncbi:MAG TPA: hypothetical protein VJH91_02160 [Candidatus Paceibacterota bacterium]